MTKGSARSSLRQALKAGVCVLALLPAMHGQIKVKDRSRFCVRHGDGVPVQRGRGEVASATFADKGDGQWRMQGWPPLIDEKAGVVYEQAIFTGKWLSKVRLRSFREDYQLLVEYRFNESGELLGTLGGIHRGQDWYAEAKLYSDGKGGVSEPSVTYSYKPDGLPIAPPEDGRDYAPMLATVPIYKTTNEIPCAGLLKAAETADAGQR